MILSQVDRVTVTRCLQSQSQSHTVTAHSRVACDCSGTAFALFWHYFRTILSLFLRGVASRITLFSNILSSRLSSRLTRTSSGPAASHSLSLSLTLSLGLSAGARYGRDLLCRPDRATLRRAAAAAAARRWRRVADGGGGGERWRRRRRRVASGGERWRHRRRRHGGWRMAAMAAVNGGGLVVGSAAEHWDLFSRRRAAVSIRRDSLCDVT